MGVTIASSIVAHHVRHEVRSIRLTHLRTVRFVADPGGIALPRIAGIKIRERTERSKVTKQESLVYQNRTYLGRRKSFAWASDAS